MTRVRSDSLCSIGPEKRIPGSIVRSRQIARDLMATRVENHLLYPDVVRGVRRDSYPPGDDRVCGRRCDRDSRKPTGNDVERARRYVVNGVGRIGYLHANLVHSQCDIWRGFDGHWRSNRSSWNNG